MGLRDLWRRLASLLSEPPKQNYKSARNKPAPVARVVRPSVLPAERARPASPDREPPGTHAASNPEIIFQNPRPTWNEDEITGLEFNFHGLGPLYVEALKNNRPTLAVKLQNGVGQFTFMMFFADDDREQYGKYGPKSHDELYIYLGRIKTLLKFKVYGDHKQGVFKVYLKPEHDAFIRQELDIKGGQNRFVLRRFLFDLNRSFPRTSSLADTIENFRRYRFLFEGGELQSKVDDALKVHFIGIRSLPPNKRPRERTLRKLYLLEGNVAEIADFINRLKEANKTVAWTDDPRRATSSFVKALHDLHL